MLEQDEWLTAPTVFLKLKIKHVVILELAPRTLWLFFAVHIKKRCVLNVFPSGWTAAGYVPLPRVPGEKRVAISIIDLVISLFSILFN